MELFRTVRREESVLFAETVDNRRASCVAGDVDRRAQHVEDTVDAEENRQRINRDARRNEDGDDEQRRARHTGLAARAARRREEAGAVRRERANDGGSAETPSSVRAVCMFSGSVAIEDAVENAKTCTFHIALKNFVYVVHFENIATVPPIMPYVTTARTMT